MIGKAIYQVLTADSRFNGISIGPLRTFQSLPMPSIVYMISGITPTSVKNGVSNLDEVEFSINVFSRNYAEVNTLGEAVRQNMDRLCGAYAEIQIQSIEFTNYNDLYEEGAEVYGVAYDFTARVVRGRKLTPDYASADYFAGDYSVVS